MRCILGVHCPPYARSPAAAAEEGDGDRGEEDFHIEPEGPLVDVGEVQAHPVVEVGNVVAAVDLPEAGEAGLHTEPAAVRVVFEAFHRAGNVGEIPGSGLGLLIARRCVELHGGEIGFVSEEDAGTAFTVRLPVFPQ